MHIGTLTASLGVDTHGLNKAGAAMNQFRQKAELNLSSVAKTLDKTGRNIYYFGTAAGRFLTLPLVLAGGAAIKMGKDFESSMQKIVGLVGVSQTQVDAWSKSLLAFGPEVGKGPKELADALYFVTSSGFKGAEALNIVEQSAKAAASGLGDTKDIADLATSAMNAYKNSGLTASRVMDVLTAAVREGKGEASDFAKQMGDVIPIASKMGVSFDQVAAAMASVTLTGMNVAEAATGIKRILVTLLNTTPKVEKALHSMGTSGAEMRDIFAGQGMLAGLQKVNILVNKFGEDMIGKVFPNVRALIPVLSLTGDRLNENVKLFDVVNKSVGSSAKAFEAVTKTIDFKYNKAVATAQKMMIEFSAALKGPIIGFMEGFTQKVQALTKWFTNLTKAQQETVLKFGVFLAAIGPLAVGIGLLSRALAGLTLALNFMKMSFVALISPMGLVLTAASLLVIGLFKLSGTFSDLSGEYITHAESLRRMESAHSAFLGNLNNEEGSLYSLFGALKRTNENTEVRKNLIDTINTKYGEYLPNLLTEKTTLAEIEKIEKDTVKAMSSKLALQTQTERINAILQQQMEDEQSMLSALSKIETGVQAPLTSWIVALNDYEKHWKEVITTSNDGFKDAVNGFKHVKQETVSASDELMALAKVTGLPWQKIADSFDELIEKRNMDGKAIEGILALYEKYITKVKEVNTTASEITVKSNPYKKMYDDAREALDMYSKEMEKLTAPVVQAPEFAEPIDYRKHFMRIADVGGPLENLNNQLARIALHNALVTDSFNASEMSMKTLDEQIQYTSQMYDLLFSIYPKGNALVDIYIEKLKELKTQQESVNRTTEIGNTVAREFAQALDGNIESLQDLGNALRRATINAISAYIADAVVYNAKQAVKTSKNPYIAIIKAAAIAAATRATMESIVPKFAEGGKVPAGYPNDTYPALLTSGEIVTPPGKLENLQKQGGMKDGEVVFRIEGYDLVGILKKYSNKLNTV